MAPRERRESAGTMQKFSKGSSKDALAKESKKARKKEEKQAKKEALKRQKEKDAKVKKKEAAKHAKPPGLFARLFKPPPKPDDGTPTDPDWIPAKETEGPKKGKGKLSSFFNGASPGQGSKGPDARSSDSKPKGAGNTPSTEDAKAESKEDKQDDAEEPKEDKGKATYEAALADKDAAGLSSLKQERHFCLGIVDLDEELPSPDDAPWAFSRPWHVAFLLAHRLPEEGRLPMDALTGGWVFHDPPEGTVLRIGRTKEELLAPERAYTGDAWLRWQEGLDTVLITAKAGEREFKARVRLPQSKKETRHSGVVLLVDATEFTRAEG